MIPVQRKCEVQEKTQWAHNSSFICFRKLYRIWYPVVLQIPVGIRDHSPKPTTHRETNLILCQSTDPTALVLADPKSMNVRSPPEDLQ